MHVASLLVLAAIGVSAHPSGHAHMHRHAHQKRNPEPKPDPAVGDLVTATIMGKVVSWTNTYDGSGSPFKKAGQPEVSSASPSSATPSPTPSSSTTAAAAATATSKATSSDSSSGSGTGITSYQPFCNGKATVVKRATIANIAYTGNTGTSDDWGCNMMLVANAETASKYKYTMKIKNASQNKQTCTCFNKIGPTGLIDGFFHEGPTWTMAGGATQYVAFDDNSQGGCVCNEGDSLRKTSLGQFAGTWIESDFGSSVNNKWSGADISSIVADNYKLSVDGAQVCYSGTCSTIYPGGKADNAYTGGMEDLDGVGLNIPPGNVQLDVKVAFSG